MLAWDGRDEVASTAKAAAKRSVFEGNLRKEGLVVESLGDVKLKYLLEPSKRCSEAEEQKGLNFVRIAAPEDVLKRYAEILNLRLPMKKVRYQYHEQVLTEFRPQMIRD